MPRSRPLAANGRSHIWPVSKCCQMLPLSLHYFSFFKYPQILDPSTCVYIVQIMNSLHRVKKFPLYIWIGMVPLPPVSSCSLTWNKIGLFINFLKILTLLRFSWSSVTLLLLLWYMLADRKLHKCKNLLVTPYLTSNIAMNELIPKLCRWRWGASAWGADRCIRDGI